LQGSRRWTAGLACALSVVRPVGAAPERASEYAIKAAFLFNFSKYVEWPEGAFTGPAAPIAICVLGVNPFGSLLREDVKDKRVNGRELVVREATLVSATVGCHIVFIASSERGRLDEILGALAQLPSLTVSDEESAADRGVILGLTLKEKTVRIEVNLIAARRAQLRLSSQLLKVAVRLIGQDEMSER
jgi:hypothetical protein